jgi:uncharacterized protein
MQAEWVGFDWDEGNASKNWEKHGVTDSECEEVFFNTPFGVGSDIAHSRGEEPRWRALGQTDRGRHLFIAFTVRRNLIRVISARETTRRERRIYATYEETKEA